MRILKKIFLNEHFILSVIILNAAIIFAQESGCNYLWLQIADLVCTIIFIIEMAVKQSVYGIQGYWHDSWNCLDGTLVILSLPSVVAFFVPAGVLGNLSVLLVLRLLRVLRFFRIIHIFPNFSTIAKNFSKAMRDSYGVFAGFLVLIVIVALVSCALFRDSAPEYFATPIDSIYSIFRICTGEGVERDTGHHCRGVHNRYRALGTAVLQHTVGAMQYHRVVVGKLNLCGRNGKRQQPRLGEESR